MPDFSDLMKHTGTLKFQVCRYGILGMQIWTFTKLHTFKYDFWEKTQYSNMNFWCFLVTPVFKSANRTNWSQVTIGRKLQDGNITGNHSFQSRHNAGQAGEGGKEGLSPFLKSFESAESAMYKQLNCLVYCCLCRIFEYVFTNAVS